MNHGQFYEHLGSGNIYFLGTKDAPRLCGHEWRPVDFDRRLVVKAPTASPSVDGVGWPESLMARKL
jgi:hypothetical protein